MYKTVGNSWICLTYGNLLDHFADEFPQKISAVVPSLTSAEKNAILGAIPFLLSSGKWKDKREKLQKEIEEVLK